MSDSSTPSSQPVPALLLIIATIVAGSLGGLAAASAGNVYEYPPELAAALSNPNADVDFEEVRMWDMRMLNNNTSIAAGLAGLILGAILGAVGNLKSNLPKGLVLGIVIGTIGGVLGGLVGAQAWQIIFYQGLIDAPAHDTTVIAGTANSVIWGIIGIAIGIVVCLSRSPTNGAVAGLVGGVLGAWLFFALAISVFPNVNTNKPLPKLFADTPWYMARVLWVLVPSTVIGLLVARSGSSKRHDAPANNDAETDDDE